MASSSRSRVRRTKAPTHASRSSTWPRAESSTLPTWLTDRQPLLQPRRRPARCGRLLSGRLDGEGLGRPLRREEVQPTRRRHRQVGRLLAQRATARDRHRRWQGRVSDADEARPRVRHPGGDGGIDPVSFSPDGRLLVASSADQTASVWDVTTHKPVGGTFPVTQGAIPTAQFAPDGELVIVGLSDAAVWPMDPEVWKDFACQAAGRDLTTPNGGTSYGPRIPADLSAVGRRVASEATDAALLARCREGDEGAWAELVERFSGYVYAILSRGFRMADHESEDVFQEGSPGSTRSSIDSRRRRDPLVARPDNPQAGGRSLSSQRARVPDARR